MSEQSTTGKSLAPPDPSRYNSGNGTGRGQIAPRVLPAPSPYRPGGGRPLRGSSISPTGAASNPPPSVLNKIHWRLSAMAKHRDEILTLLRHIAEQGQERLPQQTMQRLAERLVQSVTEILLGEESLSADVSRARAPARKNKLNINIKNTPRDSLRNSPTGNSSKNPSDGSGHLTFAAPAGGRLSKTASATPPPPGIGEREMVRWVICEGYRRLGKVVVFSTQVPHLKKHLADVARRVRECFRDGYTIEHLLTVADLAAAERREKGNVKGIRWMGNLALLWRPTHVRNTLIIDEHAKDLPAPKLRKASTVVLRTGADRDRWMAGLRDRWAAGSKNPSTSA